MNKGLFYLEKNKEKINVALVMFYCAFILFLSCNTKFDVLY